MASEFEKREAKARVYLIVLSTLVFIAACTATATYSYPETFGPYQEGLVITHDLVGDLAILVSVLYIANHLRKTWRMRKQLVSRYSGIFIVGIWMLSAITGLYGHFYKLEDGGFSWGLHFVSSVAIIVFACFHGVWAYRPRKRAV